MDKYTSPREFCDWELHSDLPRIRGEEHTLLGTGDFATANGTGSYLKVRQKEESGSIWYLGEVMIQRGDYYMSITIIADYEDEFEELCASLSYSDGSPTRLMG